MERLTQWIGEDEDRRAIPRPDIRSNGHGRCCNKLAEYEDAEKQGLLVRLPCKVGDAVYRVNAGAKQPIIPMTVSEIHFLCYKNERAVRFDAIGNGLCDRTGQLIDDDDHCDSWHSDWRDAMMRTFLGRPGRSTE